MTKKDYDIASHSVRPITGAIVFCDVIFLDSKLGLIRLNIHIQSLYSIQFNALY